MFLLFMTKETAYIKYFHNSNYYYAWVNKKFSLHIDCLVDLIRRVLHKCVIYFVNYIIYVRHYFITI